MDSTRSSRRRQPLKKYSVDAFAGLELTGDLEDDGQTAVYVHHDDDDADDDEFQAAASPDLEKDEISVDGDGDDEHADEYEGGEHDFDEEEDEDLTVLNVDLLPGARQHGSSRARQTRTGPPPVRKPQCRGLFESRIRGSKESMRRAIFGAADSDRQPALQAHYKWFREATLPSRTANAAGFGGFHKGFYRTEQMRRVEMTQDWAWYESEGGKQALQSRAVFSVLEEERAHAYLPRPNRSRVFLMGPYKKQKLSHLPVGQSMDLNHAWTIPDDNGQPAQDPQSLRYGFLLNLGDKIQCLDWAPNQSTARQFLAVSTSLTTGQDGEHVQFQEPVAPAFSAQAPHKAAIQIWEFSSNAMQRVDTKRPPKLRQVICTEWGEFKALKWCPVPRKEDKAQESVSLGLLAIISGDGAVRVLDVSVGTQNDEPTQYIRCTLAAFSSRPTNTVPTCITWLSSTGIAAGCANGCVAIWNLSLALRHPESNPTPVLYSLVQTSYLLAITSCYPSRPHILLTTSMAGYITMTDLSDLSTNTAASPATTVLTPRSRIGRTILVWHDWSQMALTVDDNYTLSVLPIRRLYGYAGLTRYKSPPLAVAVSPVHPFLITGTADGDCVSYNVMRRAFDGKAPMLNQTWFSHEWRPSTEAEKNAASGLEGDTIMRDTAETEMVADTVAQSIASRGLIRILEGFKTDTVKLLHDDGGALPKLKLPNQEQGAPFSTVYEVESGVTQVCWNPNLHVGGWTAAGMASGLLRVEDIAL